MKLNTNEVEGGHCLICRLPATFVNGEWHCDQHLQPGPWDSIPLCEWCTEHHLPEDGCEDEPIDADDFTTGGYGGMYQR
jgi:hypothetical protein